MSADYVLIQGDTDCGVALCDRNTGTVLLNESTTPALTVNGQTGLYSPGCRGAIVREGLTSNFWVFVQDAGGSATLFLTRIAFTPAVGSGTVPTFTTQSFTLSLGNFARGSARWLPDGSIIFAAGLSIYKFFPGTGTASVIFTAAGGDGAFANGEVLRLSNVSGGKVLAFTLAHIYRVNAATGAQISSVAVTVFSLTASTLQHCLFDGANIAWAIAQPSPGANGNVYALNLNAITKVQLTTGTDYINHVMVLNPVAGVLGLVLSASATITTVATNGGAVNTGTLPALSTGALGIDDAGYFWTADNFATDIGTPTWKIDPVSLTVVLTIGARFFGTIIPVGDVPRGQDFGFATPGITIGHAANLNAYDNGGALAPAFPPGNGELIQDIEPLRKWCRANGISIALCQDSQRTAKDLLDELLTVGNSAPVYSGNRLKIIPYDEVSAAGFGAIYVSPTASGPVADLADKDFALDASGKTAPLKFKRKRRASCDNIVAIEHIDRALDYAHNVTTEIAQMQVSLYGPRKGGTLDATELGVNTPSGSKSILSIHSAAVAQAIASILAKRGAAGVNEYQFTLKAEWFSLEAMDLVTITDSRLGLVKVPVRLTSAKETSDRKIACTGEAFVYGLNHPDVKATTAATGTLVLANVDPGLVNTPIILEPPAGMLPAGAGPQVWMLVSGADPNYGGCIPNVSVDGGSVYNPLGNIGPAVTGLVTGTFAVGADPDTVHALAVDLTESNGSLSTQSQQIADGFADPCFVESASGFEAVCPTVATLTSAEHYSMGTYIRRGVGGTVIASHAAGKRFGVLDGSTFKIDLPAQWVGKTIHLKFQAYNKLGGQLNPLSACVDYTFTPVSTFLPGGFYVNGS
jgi:hypothetical protein